MKKKLTDNGQTPNQEELNLSEVAIDNLKTSIYLIDMLIENLVDVLNAGHTIKHETVVIERFMINLVYRKGLFNINKHVKLNKLNKELTHLNFLQSTPEDILDKQNQIDHLKSLNKDCLMVMEVNKLKTYMSSDNELEKATLLKEEEINNLLITLRTQADLLYEELADYLISLP